MNNLTDLEAMHAVLKEFEKITKTNREILLGMLNKEHILIGERVDDPCAELKHNYQHAGGRSNAMDIFPYIRDVRKFTGMGFKEAKDLVESW